MNNHMNNHSPQRPDSSHININNPGDIKYSGFSGNIGSVSMNSSDLKKTNVNLVPPGKFEEGVYIGVSDDLYGGIGELLEPEET